jgi:hypothetical protein
MKFEMKAQIIKFSDTGIQNCDIYKKFSLSASTIATVPKEKIRILEVVKQASPFLSTVVQEYDKLTAEGEHSYGGMLKLGALRPSSYGRFRSRLNSCRGGVEYLHRDPASSKRRRNGVKKGRAIA